MLRGQDVMSQVTLHDVAAAAGVSAQTVSRVVNQRPDVAAATRTRVWKAIRQLGYQPNVMARGLVSRRSHVLGVITLPLDDYFRSEVVAGLEKEARAHGYACHLSFTQARAEDLPELIEGMMARQVEGSALLVPMRIDFPPLNVACPVVTVAHPLTGPRALNVDVDNVDGAYQAVSRLLQLGHRQIGQVTGPLDWTAAADRVEGARRALAEYGIENRASLLSTCAGWTLHDGYAAARSLLAAVPEVTALFCHNDWMALGAYRALREAGRRIPQEVSVVGYDDLPMCEFIDPPLSSVRQPSQGLGRLMAQMVVAAIARPEPWRQEMLIPAELVMRKSAAAPIQMAVPVSG
jgi:DNA-binding LacI/PurR family transcriptional regulator